MTSNPLLFQLKNSENILEGEITINDDFTEIGETSKILEGLFFLFEKLEERYSLSYDKS